MHELATLTSNFFLASLFLLPLLLFSPLCPPTHPQPTLQHAGIISNPSSARVRGGGRTSCVVFLYSSRQEEIASSLTLGANMKASHPHHTNHTAHPYPTHPPTESRQGQQAGEARGRRRYSSSPLCSPPSFSSTYGSGLGRFFLSAVKVRGANTDRDTHTYTRSVRAPVHRRRPASVIRRCVCGRRSRWGGREGGGG